MTQSHFRVAEISPDPSGPVAYRIKGHVEGLEGWTLGVVVHLHPEVFMGSLTLEAEGVREVLTSRQLRLVKPLEVMNVALARAVQEEWQTSDEAESVHGLKRLPSGRFRRDDDYLRRLARRSIERAGAPSVRAQLAREFGRTPSQIRDDLEMARKKEFLADGGFGVPRVAGPKLDAGWGGAR